MLMSFVVESREYFNVNNSRKAMLAFNFNVCAIGIDIVRELCQL